MDPEYLAVYVAIACAVWVASCGCCRNGIEPTAVIDVLAGCKSICWDPARWFGWNRGGWWNIGGAGGWGGGNSGRPPPVGGPAFSPNPNKNARRGPKQNPFLFSTSQT